LILLKENKVGIIYKNITIFSDVSNYYMIGDEHALIYLERRVKRVTSPISYIKRKKTSLLSKILNKITCATT